MVDQDQNLTSSGIPRIDYEIRMPRRNLSPSHPQTLESHTFNYRSGRAVFGIEGRV